MEKYSLYWFGTQLYALIDIYLGRLVCSSTNYECLVPLYAVLIQCNGSCCNPVSLIGPCTQESRSYSTQPMLAHWSQAIGDKYTTYLYMWVLMLGYTVNLLRIFSVNALRPRQNGQHFADDIFKCIFLNENIWILIDISRKFVPKDPINNITILVQILAWHWPGNKPLSESVMVNLLTHKCVTLPQWVNAHKDKQTDKMIFFMNATQLNNVIIILYYIEAHGGVTNFTLSSFSSECCNMLQF